MFPAQVNKGPLVPGQVIQVNKFSVQVERYLAQGGYAHVYLVRTPAPVYNTTHHVLKRMGVPNEAMLAEVKKEVDTMRLLQGHPNIVHLIDASWQRAQNGTYEVYILMEYCPGGGIIDMMNRRLRERLTESEILQIFIDVCEGVAYMHNLRPALLHRDLKVENILQSSSSSYKLCDFGSAKAVSRSPTTNQEIRALEADLNKHTTLQYRAPEMIDLYQRRPVDEKSDVWALGVLLYKLCYYTTPFEEHPTLAILNVQYKFPPYPVYSPRMNQLIASMLQEHGMRRPTVFELLDYVHSLRGTKSRFKYNRPSPAPLTSRQPKATSPNTPSSAGVPIAPRPIAMSISPSKPQTQGVPNGSAPNSASHVVPEPVSKPTTPADVRYPEPQIVPPMRRGRPAVSASKENVPVSELKLDLNDQKSKEEIKNWLDEGFDEGGSKAWRPMGPTTPGKEDLTGAWNVEKKPEIKADRQGTTGTSFGDNFGDKLWDSFGKQESKDPGKLSPGISPLQPSGRLSPRIAVKKPSPGFPPSKSSKDAFEGLGLHLAPDRPAPTLGEARKLRTGLALMSASGFKVVTPNKSPAPTPKLSPSPGIQPSIQLPAVTSIKSPSAADTHISTPSSRFRAGLAESPGPSKQLDSLPAESRFPSLEELDASFPTRSGSSSLGLSSQKVNLSRTGPVEPTPTHVPPPSRHRESDSLVSPPVITPLRSGHFTGQVARKQPSYQDSLRSAPAPKTADAERPIEARPTLAPRTSTFSSAHSGYSDPSPSASSSALARKAAEGSLNAVSSKQNDWLTGEDDHVSTPSAPSPAPTPNVPRGKPILRDSPVKRAAVMQAAVPIQTAISAEPAQIAEPEQLIPLSPPPPLPPKSEELRSHPITRRSDSSHVTTSRRPPSRPSSRKSSRLTDAESSPDDEGPEDASVSRFRRSVTTKATAQADVNPPKRTHKGRQSSVHDLVDLYGGGVTHKEKERDFEAKFPVSPRSRMSVAPHLPPKPLATLSTGSSSISNPLLSPPASQSVEKHSPTSSSPRKPRQTAGALPARARPQSMLLFPSKSTDSGVSPTSPQFTASPSNSTSQSDENRRKTMRRTSISNMVQRYEDINSTSSPASIAQPLPGLAKPGARPVGRAHDKEPGARSTSTVHRHVTNSSITDSPASQGQSLPGFKPTTKSHSGVAQPLPGLAKPLNTGSGDKEARIRTTSKGAQPLPGLAKPLNTGSRDKETRIRTTSSAAQPLPGLAKPLNTGSGDREARIRTTSSTARERPIGLPKSPSRKGTLSSSPPDARRAQPRHRVNSSVSREKEETTSRQTPVKPPAFPPPKPITDEQLLSTDHRSASPERPYQGVGKLIDQWQKKTEEAGSSRGPTSPKRIASKRSGTIYHS